jgi:hypothetical protein
MTLLHRSRRPTAGGLRREAPARSRRAASITRAIRNLDTDARLTEHRLEPALDKIDEPGDETPRGTFGRGRLGVEVGATTSALSDSLVPNSAEPLAPRALLSEPPTLVTIGGSGTMSLNTFDRVSPFNRMQAVARTAPAPEAVPSPASMRLMETGLAFVAIAVALLLNLGR